MGLVFTGATKFTLGDVVEMGREPFASQGIAAVAGLIVVGLGGALASLAYAATGGVLLPPAPRYVFGGFAALVIPLLVLARRKPIWIVSAVLALLGLASWWFFPLT